MICFLDIFLIPVFYSVAKIRSLVPAYLLSLLLPYSDYHLHSSGCFLFYALSSPFLLLFFLPDFQLLYCSGAAFSSPLVMLDRPTQSVCYPTSNCTSHTPWHKKFRKGYTVPSAGRSCIPMFVRYHALGWPLK